MPIVLSLSAGIIAGRFDVSLWIPAIAAILAITAVIFRQYYTASIIAVFAIGSIDMSSRMPHEDITPYTLSERYYKAKILSTSDNDNSQSAIAELTAIGDDSLQLNATKKIRVQVTIPSFEKEFQKGYDIQFKARFEPIESQTDLPDEIDGSVFLKNKLVAARTLIPPEQVYSVKPTEGFLAKAIRLRTRLTEKLYRTSLNPETKEFINATLLGDSKDLSDDTRQIFSASGLSHILALSGLHVGVIALLIAFALWPIKFFGLRHIVMAVTILILWGYVSITGFSPSVTRAAVMMSIYLLGLMFQRRTSAINSLMAAALIILIVSPEELFGIGFQLSFSAVLSIILFADLINPVNRKRRMLYLVTSYISLSISAVAGTSIISAYYFHSMPIYFIISNLSVAIFLPVILGGGILILILSSICVGTDFLCKGLDYVYDIILQIAVTVTKIPYATLSDIYLSSWTIAIYIFALATLYFWLKQKRLIWGMTFILMIVLTFATNIFTKPSAREPHLYIAREKYRTDIIIDNGSRDLYIITTTHNEPNAVIDRAQRRYADYMGKREIDSIRIINDRVSYPAFAYSQNLIQFGNKSIVLANNMIPNISRSVNYLIVCRGYRGSIADLIDRFAPDTLLLSTDLNIKRAKRYEEECIDKRAPYLNLRNTQWNLAYEE